MDWSLLWKAVVVVIAGTLFLRLAGRKSISQMTLAQTVIMIGLGSLLVQPIVGHNVWSTMLVGLMLIITLIVIEFLEVKVNRVEGLVTGRAKIVILDGVLQEQTLRKLRFTVDQLEMELRQQNITRIEDVKWATLEPNGQVGCELMESAKPATKQDLYILRQELEAVLKKLDAYPVPHITENIPAEQSLFTETANKDLKNGAPKRLE
ncbi:MULTISPECIES: DUF421 domain-containing protein [Sporosarcina]|uniref:DUF421 domain-containing protein n=1 Tax=Sporosarcina TaxID=1569 RepID=UPI00058E0CBB|nr:MULTISPECIES: DUF421 domain-containing protein [Sporosarcina]WJY26906.1 DUF421 domain-containing protein [Sporosarcina sp. 0.2-SM1T-5]